MIKYLLLFFFTFCTFLCYSQQASSRFKPFVEAGGGPGTGLTHDLYPVFLNIRGGVGYQLSEKANLIGSSGYVQFFRKNNKKGASYIPLAGGIDYNMSEKVFLEMQIGGAWLLKDDELNFIAEPGIGWDINTHHSLRISYYGFAAIDFIIGGINFSYRLKL